MYKIWNVEDVKNYIHELERKSGFYLEDNVSIKITSAKSYMGVCKLSPKNDRYFVSSIYFSKYVLNGSVRSKDVKSIIAHEFCHAWTEHGISKKEIQKLKNQFQDYGHECKSFKDKCKILNCISEYKIPKELAESINSQIKQEYKNKEKYRVRCTECGASWNVARDLSFKEYTTNYICGKCKGKVEIVEILLSSKEDKINLIKGYLNRAIKNCPKESNTIYKKYDSKNSTFSYNIKFPIYLVDTYMLKVMKETKINIQSVLKDMNFIKEYGFIEDRNNLKLTIKIDNIEKIDLKSF